jgi:acetyl-CoA carboxylase biotin carboxylase subunit
MKLRKINKVLVANRGEIAVRVIRACHAQGIAAAAVFSDPDADALHVRMADDSRHIGPAPSSDSYLRADKVLAAAKEMDCDAVHPGYGFLSENAQFARAVEAAGMVWIGPPPFAIDQMGSKTEARQRMSKAGVPIVPGTTEPVSGPDDAKKIAREVGYPIMLKASAGGGGKGMRLVHSESEIENALIASQSESRKAFGDDAVYIEKAIIKPRHVEIQVLADAYGNVVHLFERDCSIQRRHQKVFEETPCPRLDETTRNEMAQAAILAATAVDYVGVGTVEFLLSSEGAFYFLEMNTRLQVEHPITEMLTGVDLVSAQLRVARGERLWMSQEEIIPRGHAVECRVYAENVPAGFQPSPGPILRYREPTGPFVRVDSGLMAGAEVPIHYDPMIAKLVVWGEDRKSALARARAAILEYIIVGTTTSLPFFLSLFEDEAFQNGDYATDFISTEWIDKNLGKASALSEDDLYIAAALEMAREVSGSHEAASGGGTGGSAWVRSHRWTTMNRRRS